VIGLTFFTTCGFSSAAFGKNASMKKDWGFYLIEVDAIAIIELPV